MELGLPDGARGVLPDHYLERAIEAGVISADRFTVPTENIQPASLDLRLGDTAYRIRCSFLPGPHPVEAKLKDLVIDELDLRRDGALLETNVPYLVPLKERLALPAELRAKANPKSSTGRADVFTRVISDRGSRFDEIAAGYHGQLYLEVVPLSFPVRVREDLSLNQLRISMGESRLTDAEIRMEHDASALALKDGEPLQREELNVASGLFLGLDLRGNSVGHVGYRARKSAPLLDMARSRAADPEKFWESVRREEGDRIVLWPKDFYLLMSREGVSIPPGLAAEMTAYDPTSGELRTHYAGFFDPGFGYDSAKQGGGSTAALEVRAHDIPFMVEHGQPVCKLTFERMLAIPSNVYGQREGSHYQFQTEALGKHFRGMPAQEPRADEQEQTTDQLGLWTEA
jgi:dCTP deaminase